MDFNTFIKENKQAFSITGSNKIGFICKLFAAIILLFGTIGSILFALDAYYYGFLLFLVYELVVLFFALGLFVVAEIIKLLAQNVEKQNETNKLLSEIKIIIEPKSEKSITQE